MGPRMLSAHLMSDVDNVDKYVEKESPESVSYRLYKLDHMEVLLSWQCSTRKLCMKCRN